MTVQLAERAARYAERCCERGLVLTWTPPGAKGPRHLGWKLEAKAIKRGFEARKFWQAHPGYGIGALLQYSGLVTLDIDHLEHSRTIFVEFGVDLDELRRQASCVIGNPAKFRALYRAPAGVELRHRTVMWPKQENRAQGFAVFELRAGSISDALPPSIHAGTGQPYRWENPPRHGFPPLPPRLLELWLDWENFNKRARALCPWAPPPKEAPAPKPRKTEYTGPSVIRAFNEAHDVTAILEAHGYERKGKRYASPGASHNAGIVQLGNGKVYCHHAGDPLRSEHALDAFDLYRVLEHGGAFGAAVRSAAEALGLNQRDNRSTV